MCQEAVVENRKGRIWVDTVGELAKVIGVKVARIPIKQMYGDQHRPRHKECLCPVDFGRLANLRGYTMTRHNWDDGHNGEIELREVCPRILMSFGSVMGGKVQLCTFGATVQPFK